MVLADLGRKITTALRSLSNATIINEEVCFLIYLFTISSYGQFNFFSLLTCRIFTFVLALTTTSVCICNLALPSNKQEGKERFKIYTRKLNSVILRPSQRWFVSQGESHLFMFSIGPGCHAQRSVCSTA